MAGLFGAVVDGVKGIVDVASASIQPYKVQTVKISDYSKCTKTLQDGHMTLYKKHGCFDCVLSNQTIAGRLGSFSVFRLMGEGEAVAQFNIYSPKLNILVASSSSVYQESMLQCIFDAIRAHPFWTAAHVASHMGLFECFHHDLVKRELNCLCPMSGESPLMTAVRGKQLQCVTDLINLGARIDLQDENGDTVYHYAVIHHPDTIPVIASHDKSGVVNFLNRKGWTALASACHRSSPSTVEMLLDASAEPQISAQEMLPIHYAMDVGDEKCVELICMKHKDQLEARDNKNGGTPIHWSKNRKVIEKLCRLGADLNTRSKTGHTPLHVMIEKSRPHCIMELLCFGADASIGDLEGNAPLHHAVMNDDVDSVKTFIVYGADVNLKNNLNQTPRHLVCTSNGKNKDCILYMLHVSGAKRCEPGVKGCLGGCYTEGKINGKPEAALQNLLEIDHVALCDEMMGSICVDEVDGKCTDRGYRLLALDGGGIRGLILVQILMAIEKEIGKPIRECFDWIAGTSTGGLLALGICQGMSLTYMKGMYTRLKDEVFKGKRPYSSENFEEMLKREFGEEKVMTDFKHPRAMVTAVLADRHPSKLHIFRTYHHTLQMEEEPTDKKDNKFMRPPPPDQQKVWQAARSSGAAPTYFKASGAFVDGGLSSNNPTMDLLTEIHEYNCGLRIRNESHLVRKIGVVVSLGTGVIPVVPVQGIDVYLPGGLFEATKVAKGISSLINLLTDQATIAEGRPVDRSRAWCGMLGIPFYRFSPKLSEDIALDSHDDKKLIQMMWETQCYIVANHDRIKKLVTTLRRE